MRTTAKDKDYWKERMEALEDENYRSSMAYYKDVQEQFRQASNSMQMDIERWYRRLAENNDISYASAKKFLKSSELEEFKWSVEQYIKAGRENAVDQRWMKELENASARFHISYLEAMKLQAQQHAELLSAEFEGGMTDFLHKSYAEQFYRTAFEVSKGVGTGFNLARLDDRRIDMLLKHPWAQDGKNFSDRIWSNKEKLVTNLHTELAQCIIRGESPRSAIARLAKKMDVSKAQAGNVIMTESAAISSAAQQECYKELGVEQYQFDATLDGITCEVCQGMDQKVFKMSEYEVGVTANPIHPRCRCCTTPYFDDWEEFDVNVERAARAPESGKTVYVDGNLDYEGWKKEAFSEKGLAAGNQNFKDFPEHDDPVKIGKIDFNDKNMISSVLEECENQIADKTVENAVVIMKDGTVWQCFGDLNGVYPDLDLGSGLFGACVTHNHPVGSANEYSFSNSDIKMFLENKLKVLRGIDERYVYELTRDSGEVDDYMSLEELMGSDGDCARHQDVIRIAKENGFGYRRWRR